MQTAAMRERMFTMRLSEEESERLDYLARHYGLNAVGLIRMLLKREDDAVAVTKAAERLAAEAAISPKAELLRRLQKMNDAEKTAPKPPKKK